jgi:hypothetical protein
MQNVPQKRQSYSFQSGIAQTDGYQPQSACLDISLPSQSESQRDDSSQGELQFAEGLVESLNGPSIIGTRIVNGIPELVWGEDRRNLPWG